MGTVELGDSSTFHNSIIILSRISFTLGLGLSRILLRLPRGLFYSPSYHGRPLYVQLSQLKLDHVENHLMPNTPLDNFHPFLSYSVFFAIISKQASPEPEFLSPRFPNT